MRVLAALGGTCLLASALYAQWPSENRIATACAGLTSLSLSNTTVTSAVITAGKFAPPAGQGREIAGLPGFCRVSMTIKPSADSDIKAEAWLPLTGWNGKFQEVGNGAWGGSVQYAALAQGLRRGYAMASTDTGHTGTDASFAAGHPEKLIDFGYRAIHETALQSKAVLAKLYGSEQKLSYFMGCSGGGRQGFMEAQRYPEDFDGIVAGAPGYDRTRQSVQLVRVAQATHATRASFIPPEKYLAIHTAALKACDALDGVTDGLISEPLRCHFDPVVIRCKGKDGPSCLTAAQVQAARKIYADVKDPKTGQVIFPGQEPGSELLWGGTAGGARPLAVADDLFKDVVFRDPNWDFRTTDVNKEYDQAMKVDNGVLTASSTDIKTFIGRGGKMIMYHGWADQNISSRSSVNYYNRLVTDLGQQQVDDSVRLYMVPGMGHCGGGDGPNQFDMLTGLEQWREQGTPPKDVIASKVTDGKVIRTRPLCPYPQVARYKGTGSIDDAQNFACQMP